jgi:hypothetical protein
VAALRRLGHQPRVWVPVLAISALFLLPIVINLALHWPGPFVKYFTYSKSGAAGGHTAAQVAQYILWFWWPGQYRWLAPLLLFAAALAVTFGLTRGPLRRFLALVIVFDLVASAAVGIYAVAGIDTLDTYYIVYFYWAAPFLLLLVVAVGIAQAIGVRAGTTLAAAGAAAALVVFAVTPGTLTSVRDDDPPLPRTVAALAARSDGHPVVLSVTAHSAWPDATGLLVQAERSHVRACVQQPYWEFMMTSQFICTPQQLARGVRYAMVAPGAPGPVIARLRVSAVMAESAR